MMKNKRRVLFLSTNSLIHAQMAEALLRLKSEDSVEVYSADVHSMKISSDILQSMTCCGIALENMNSRSMTELSGQHFDYLILLSEHITEFDFDDISATQQLTWDITADLTHTKPSCLNTLFEQLNSRITMLLTLNTDTDISKQANEVALVDPISFYKCLTDEIRLKTIMLTHYYGELCVCDLMYALQEDSQPKVSRNLAVLKKNNILNTRKQGQWVFYRINEQLPIWIKSVIAKTTESNNTQMLEALQRITEIKQSPQSSTACQ